MDVHLDGVVCYRYCEQSVIDTVNSKHIEVHLFFAAYSKLGANIDVVFMKEKKKSPLNNTVISTICNHKKKKTHQEKQISYCHIFLPIAICLKRLSAVILF